MKPKIYIESSPYKWFYTSIGYQIGSSHRKVIYRMKYGSYSSEDIVDKKLWCLIPQDVLVKCLYHDYIVDVESSQVSGHLILTDKNGKQIDENKQIIYLYFDD